MENLAYPPFVAVEKQTFEDSCVGSYMDSSTSLNMGSSLDLFVYK